MRVAILSPEAVPFAKVGGLADVSGALTKALHAAAVDSFLILPFYDQIDQSLVSGVAIENLEVQWRGKQPRIRVLKSETLNAPQYLKDAASALKAGMIAADALSTVSPRYAQEIQTPEQGYGLDWLTRARRDRLVGITNGVDYEIWNPETDPNIAANYSAEDLTGKRECKIDLLRRFGLPAEPERPIIAIISRLVAQKGYDLIREAARGILDTGAFFIALGAGAQEYEDFLQSWHDTAPHRVGIYKGYAGEPLAHQIEAGADIFLMPSMYEPCGLNQMYSMRYGTVPLVRATGGLDDTVQPFDERTNQGNEFKFGPYAAAAMLEKIREGLYFYNKSDTWKKIQHNGMIADNSWSAAARKYIQLYEAMAETA